MGTMRPGRRIVVMRRGSCAAVVAVAETESDLNGFGSYYQTSSDTQTRSLYLIEPTVGLMMNHEFRMGWGNRDW